MNKNANVSTSVQLIFSAMLLLLGSCASQIPLKKTSHGSNSSIMQDPFLATISLEDDSVFNVPKSFGDTIIVEYVVALNLPHQWITFTSPTGSVQKFVFKEPRGNFYNIKFALKTNLQSSHATIYDYFYQHYNGYAENTKGSTEQYCNDYWMLHYTIGTATKKQSGKFTIIYIRH